ncbi:LysR family transcriptional regulator [Rhizobium sp. LjRoot254]|uniref:LysR family transcriptional regulator n=1 Tax=Rhizobium sp. LjRoot254 TaxID=3342297 RepID=UPI003ECF26AD
MPHLPNLRHLRLFIAFADGGSLTAAAEALAVTQPAASQAIRSLEQSLDATLIDRAGMEMTGEGRMVLERFRRIFDFLRQAAGTSKSATARVESRLAWPHVRSVAAFAVHGSFSAAARSLDQSEPAVQRAAREAEVVVGTPLFEGSGRAIDLTPAGAVAARQFSLALAEFESARIQLMEARHRYEGRVSIGTLPLTRTFLVPDAVAVLAGRYPQAQFEILEGSYDALIGDLERGRIDMLVGALRDGFASKTLHQERLFDYELKVVGRAGHPLMGKALITPGDLAEFSWVVARHGTPSRHVFDTMAASFPDNHPARRSVESGSLNAIRGVLLKSDHLALLSLHQMRYDLEAGFLAALDCPLPTSRRSVGLTLRRHFLPTRLQSEFLTTLREASAGLSE